MMECSAGCAGRGAVNFVISRRAQGSQSLRACFASRRRAGLRPAGSSPYSPAVRSTKKDGIG